MADTLQRGHCVECGKPLEWWLCPNTPRCPHGSVLHDIDIDRIVQRNAHPDDVGWARLAVSSLAHVWLTAEEVEAIYLEET